MCEYTHTCITMYISTATTDCYYNTHTHTNMNQQNLVCHLNLGGVRLRRITDILYCLEGTSVRVVVPIC